MSNEPAMEHAWRYFALHAEQRITVFNYFVALSSLIATGLAVTTNLAPSNWYLGMTAGVLLAALSFVFWKLDQRGSQFVKLAESALVAAEAASQIPDAQRVVTLERALNNRSINPKQPWTFGRAFRLLFVGMALVGIVGAAYSIYRGLTSAAQADPTVIPQPLHRTQALKAPAASPAPRVSNDSNAASPAGVPAEQPPHRNTADR